jgi:hypothetical protein
MRAAASFVAVNFSPKVVVHREREREVWRQGLGSHASCQEAWRRKQKAENPPPRKSYPILIIDQHILLLPIRAVGTDPSICHYPIASLLLLLSVFYSFTYFLSQSSEREKKMLLAISLQTLAFITINNLI